jgi:RNA polymerase sigma factor (sigma-70 family)
MFTDSLNTAVRVLAPVNRERIIDEVRATKLLELPLDFIGLEQFVSPGSEESTNEILRPVPDGALAVKRPCSRGGMPPYLASLYELPLLTREEESQLFREMNHLKRLASELRKTLVMGRPKQSQMDRIESLYERSVAIRNHIISANLRLVVSIAKRYVGPANAFFELVSDGNLTLMRAVEKFDISRGNRFSTYATWAIVKNYARSVPAVIRQLDRFRTGHSDMFNSSVDMRADQHEQESEQLHCESQVKKILACLDERELQIVTGRFGLTRGQQPLTLLQVGAAMGVSKERIRQIQTRAMGKLRKAAEENVPTRN